jgi:hypothetical protein
MAVRASMRQNESRPRRRIWSRPAMPLTDSTVPVARSVRRQARRRVSSGRVETRQSARWRRCRGSVVK